MRYLTSFGKGKHKKSRFYKNLTKSNTIQIKLISCIQNILADLRYITNRYCLSCKSWRNVTHWHILWIKAPQHKLAIFKNIFFMVSWLDMTRIFEIFSTCVSDVIQIKECFISNDPIFIFLLSLLYLKVNRRWRYIFEE